jgi:hypothetical protein
MNLQKISEKKNSFVAVATNTLAYSTNGKETTLYHWSLLCLSLSVLETFSSHFLSQSQQLQFQNTKEVWRVAICCGK